MTAVVLGPGLPLHLNGADEGDPRHDRRVGVGVRARPEQQPSLHTGQLAGEQGDRQGVGREILPILHTDIAIP